MEPATIGVIGSVASAAINALRGAPAAPSGVYSDPYTDQGVTLGIDFSNFTVATGQGRASATNSKSPTVPNWLKFAALGLCAIVAVRWIAKK